MSSVMFSVVLFVCLWATLKLETDCDEILLGGGEGPGWQKEVKEKERIKIIRGGTVWTTRNWTPELVTPEKGNVLWM